MNLSHDPVIVVGTTADYIERISNRLPERAVFLTDLDAYSGSETPPDSRVMQVFSTLRNSDETISRLSRYLEEHRIRPGGIACFDCESLLLAAQVAKRLSLPFPSSQAVLNSRDKLVSKRLWLESGIRCPRAILARDEDDVVAFLDILSNPVVLKPTSLSGSELTYICSSSEAAVEALSLIKEYLRRRSRDRTVNRDSMISENALLCEEYVTGDEYSCDFIRDGKEARIIRTARKHLMETGPAGTVQAYEVPGMSHERTEAIDLAGKLSRAADALGLERCMGMADFIMNDGEPCFLEITPRPGGDCLPQVIERSSGMDMLAAHIEFAAGRMPRIPSGSEWKHTVGLRLHARRRGTLSAVRLWADRVGQEILETGWYREPGDRIGLPPDDYRSWVIGHVIFRPAPGEGISDQIEDMLHAVDLRIE